LENQDENESFAFEDENSEAEEREEMTLEQKREMLKEFKHTVCSTIDKALEDISPELISRANKAFLRLKTGPAVVASIVTMYRSINSVTGRRSRIPVQETGIRRRRLGVTKSSRQLPRGRPSKAELKVRGPTKRPRCLSQAVKANVANAKPH